MNINKTSQLLKNTLLAACAFTIVGCGQAQTQATDSPSPAPQVSGSPSMADVPKFYQPTPKEVESVKNSIELFKGKKPVEAVKLLEELVDANPEMEGPIREVAAQILARGGGQPAYEISTMLVKKFPESQESLKLKAQAAFAADKTEESLAIYKSLIRKDPKNPAFYYSRGVAYARMEKHQREAIVDYSRTLELNPKFQQAFTNRAMLLGQLGKHKEAIADLNSALELAPNDSLALFNRGIIHSKLNKNDEAKKDFERVIELKAHPQAIEAAQKQLQNLGKAPATPKAPEAKK